MIPQGISSVSNHIRLRTTGRGPTITIAVLYALIAFFFHPFSPQHFLIALIRCDQWFGCLLLLAYSHAYVMQLKTAPHYVASLGALSPLFRRGMSRLPPRGPTVISSCPRR